MSATIRMASVIRGDGQPPALFATVVYPDGVECLWRTQLIKAISTGAYAIKAHKLDHTLNAMRFNKCVRVATPCIVNQLRAHGADAGANAKLISKPTAILLLRKMGADPLFIEALWKARPVLGSPRTAPHAPQPAAAAAPTGVGVVAAALAAPAALTQRGGGQAQQAVPNTPIQTAAAPQPSAQCEAPLRWGAHGRRTPRGGSAGVSAMPARAAPALEAPMPAADATMEMDWSLPKRLPPCHVPATLVGTHKYGLHSIGDKMVSPAAKTAAVAQVAALKEWSTVPVDLTRHEDVATALTASAWASHEKRAFLFMGYCCRYESVAHPRLELYLDGHLVAAMVSFLLARATHRDYIDDHVQTAERVLYFFASNAGGASNVGQFERTHAFFKSIRLQVMGHAASGWREGEGGGVGVEGGGAVEEGGDARPPHAHMQGSEAPHAPPIITPTHAAPLTPNHVTIICPRPPPCRYGPTCHAHRLPRPWRRWRPATAGWMAQRLPCTHKRRCARR